MKPGETAFTRTPTVCPLTAQLQCHVPKSAFGRGVGDHIELVRATTHDRADIHHRSGTRGKHALAALPQEKKRASEVNRHDPVERVGVVLFGRDAANIRDTRVVDEHVDGTVIRDRLLDDTHDILFDRDIAGRGRDFG